jgi:hypothetical protein
VAEAGDTPVGAAKIVRLQDGRVTMPLDPKISASVRGFDSGIDPRTLLPGFLNISQPPEVFPS